MEKRHVTLNDVEVCLVTVGVPFGRFTSAMSIYYYIVGAENKRAIYEFFNNMR